MLTSNSNHYSIDLSNSILEFMNIHYGFVMNCTTLSYGEINMPLNKKLLKKVNVLGKQTKAKTNTPLIEIYDDGTVEKKIIIE